MCWVDHILARLGEVSLVLLRDERAVGNSTRDIFHTLAKHRSEAALLAATQLPRVFYMVNL